MRLQSNSYRRWDRRAIAHKVLFRVCKYGCQAAPPYGGQGEEEGGDARGKPALEEVVDTHGAEARIAIESNV